MRLHRLSVTGFRNLKPLKLDFSDSSDWVVFLGKNGQGKTNLLESIYLLSFSKSFRAAENNDLIGFAEDFCSVEGMVDDSAETGRDLSLQIVITKNPPEKGLKINGALHKAVDFIGHLKTIFFGPDDLDIVHGAPRLRRKYLDMLLLQLDREYLIDLMRYNALLKQRNALLRQIRAGETSEKTLGVWDEKMVPLGATLIRRRLQLLESMCGTVRTLYGKISDLPRQEISIRYQFSSSEIRSPEDLESVFRHFRPRDIETGATTIGPHRDDLVFLSDQRPLSHFGSRGEWRSLVLALKLAEIDLLRKPFKTAPILLLDDVFSELDETRQGHLFDAIRGVQTFVTTTHPSFLNFMEGEKKVFRLDRGEVLTK